MKPDNPTGAPTLRQQAEERLHSRSPSDAGPLSTDETLRQLHELQVHQIELEMQNDELRQVHAENEASRVRYLNLYDLAPIGYLTVSNTALILEANLTAATLLGAARNRLVGQSLMRFILPEDEPVYLHHRLLLLDSHEPQSCELRLLPTDQGPFWVRMVATVGGDDAGGEPLCRVVISDIRTSKAAETATCEQLLELRRWQDVMLDREDRIQEIKREVNELCHRLKEPARYPSQEDGASDSDPNL